MKWNERYSNLEKPDVGQISAFIANPLWEDLCSHLQQSYGVTPVMSYSTCSGAPGWNVKYKKSGRALCTLYPDEGFFTCLVIVGSREAQEADLLLPVLTEEVQALYQKNNPMNGARWLMIPVTSTPVLEDVKKLIGLRVAKKTV